MTICSCGLDIDAHPNSNPATQAATQLIVEQRGEFIPVHVPGGDYMVPRHYIALHGIRAMEVPELAVRYGWEKKGRNDADNEPS
jgi:hypothetical protein